MIKEEEDIFVKSNENAHAYIATWGKCYKTHTFPIANLYNHFFAFGAHIVPYANKKTKAVFASRLVERSLPTPEVRGSNPVISKLYINYLLSTV